MGKAILQINNINGINTFSNARQRIIQQTPVSVHQSAHLEPTYDVFLPGKTREPYTQEPKNAFSSLQNDFLCKFFPKKFVSKYSNAEYLNNAIKNNPNIARMLRNNNLKPNVEISNINSVVTSHLIPTANYAKKIMKESREYFSESDYSNMEKAALLHDVGKTLIPPEILNKKDKLTPEDRKVIGMHDELGFELLRSSNLEPEVLELIKSHHSNERNSLQNPSVQILKVADIYSAMKENRPYRPAVSDNQAFKVLEDGAKKGDYDIKYVNYLKKAVM